LPRPSFFYLVAERVGNERLERHASRGAGTHAQKPRGKLLNSFARHKPRPAIVIRLPTAQPGPYPAERLELERYTLRHQGLVYAGIEQLRQEQTG
jgi:hypothetical protein